MVSRLLLSLRPFPIHCRDVLVGSWCDCVVQCGQASMILSRLVSLPEWTPERVTGKPWTALLRWSVLPPVQSVGGNTTTATTTTSTTMSVFGCPFFPLSLLLSSLFPSSSIRGDPNEGIRDAEKKDDEQSRGFQLTLCAGPFMSCCTSVICLQAKCPRVGEAGWMVSRPASRGHTLV